MKKFILLIFSISILLSSSACSEQNHTLDEFADCLSDKGAVVYGTYWCGNCQKQKEMFGDSSSKINFVECDQRGDNSQTELCNEKGVKKVPMWEFANGKTLTGVQKLETLAEETGCSLPKEN